MPQFDPSSYPSQIFWLAVSFGFLYLVLWRFALPKIAETLEARQTKIDENLQVARALQKEAQESMTQQETLLREARAQALATIQSASEKAQKEARAELQAAQKLLLRRMKDSEKEVEKSCQQALHQAEKVADIIAALIVQHFEEPTGQTLQ